MCVRLDPLVLAVESKEEDISELVEQLCWETNELITSRSSFGEVRMVCTALKLLAVGNEQVISDCLALPLILHKAPSKDGYLLAGMVVYYGTSVEPYLKYPLPIPSDETNELLTWILPESDEEPSEFLLRMPQPYRLRVVLGCIDTWDVKRITNDLLIEDAFYESFAEGDENLIVQALKFLV